MPDLVAALDQLRSDDPARSLRSLSAAERERRRGAE